MLAAADFLPGSSPQFATKSSRASPNPHRLKKISHIKPQPHKSTTKPTSSNKMPATSQDSNASGHKFSLRNLFPDLRTETMIANEKERVRAALAKGTAGREADKAASQRGDSFS